MTTTTLVEPERLCFLRTYMVQRIHFFACVTQNHPIILRNSLIIILRHLMANKSDEVRKRIKNSCLIPEKHVTSLLCIVIKTIQSTNFSEKRIIVNNNQFQGLTEPTLSRYKTNMQSTYIWKIQLQLEFL